MAAVAASVAAINRNRQSCHDDMESNRLSQVSTQSNGSKRSKTHVGPWRLGRTLGRGSSGRVRLAKHSVTGQLAAVKIVPKSIVGLDDQVNAGSGKDSGGLPYGIEREVIIMKLIEHPNVMALYDVWENKGELYLVLEYVEGGELFDYLIKKGRLDQREAVHYFRQIINGVHYCHKFNICHRDLKPENLLLDKNRNIKIADFGMAALETNEKMLETSCGSPHYASPEIVAGKNYHGAPSDIWSCGIILFALLCGHLPFDDDNMRNLLLKVQAGKYTMPDDLSSQAKNLIHRMLQIRPEDRITMAEILNHPLLKKYPVGNKVRTKDTLSGTPQDISRPIKSRKDIDLEILKNLQILWHGADKEKIIQRLISLDVNSEKTFYCLLMKYRHDHRHEESRTNSNHNISLNHQSHRKRSSQALNKKLQSMAASSSHSRNGSRSSIITASSSHRRSVAFQPPKKRHQRALSNKTSTEKLNDNRKSYQSHQTPDKRLSAEFASNLCERAFNFEDSPDVVRTRRITYERVVSDPIKEIERIVPERRAVSSGERRASILDPGTSTTNVISSSMASETPQEGFILPMIFEEDRFADAIEEEIDLKINHQKPKRFQQVETTATKDDKRVSSRLQISGIIKQDSFKARNSIIEPMTRKSVLEENISTPKQSVELNTFSTTSPGPQIPFKSPNRPQVRRPTQPPSPPLPKQRTPLAVKNTNAENINVNQQRKNSESKGTSLFKRFVPRRPAPAPPPPPPPVVLQPSTNVSSTLKTGEVRQNWFMKMLNLGSFDKQPTLESKIIYTKLTSRQLKYAVLEILHDWRKYGVSKITADDTIRAVISRHNVLKVRSARFKIQIQHSGGVAAAIISREGGSSATFSRFLGEIEREIDHVQH